MIQLSLLVLHVKMVVWGVVMSSRCWNLFNKQQPRAEMYDVLSAGLWNERRLKSTQLWPRNLSKSICKNVASTLSLNHIPKPSHTLNRISYQNSNLHPYWFYQKSHNVASGCIFHESDNMYFAYFKGNQT